MSGGIELKYVLALALQVACFFVLACVLSGCGDSTKAQRAHSKTVLMMRHCVRGIEERGVYDVPGFEFFNNYSTDPWPDFNPPGMLCQSYGKTVVKQSGQWFKEHGSLPEPLIVISDNSTRDITTTEQFLLGVGMNSKSYSISSGPFGSKHVPKACDLSDDEIKTAIENQLKRFPPREPEFTKIMESVVKVLGTGAAGNWANSSFTNTSCFVEANLSQHPWAPMVGGCYALNSFVERFLMEWGANLTVGWNRMQADQIPKMLQVHSWYLNVALSAPEIVRNTQASIGWAILDFLESDQQGTKIFVGHDTNQAALSSALGFSWDPNPFPSNATLPGSVLRFDFDGNDNIHVSYVFVENFTLGGDMASVPASVPGSPSGTISMKKFRELVENGFNRTCRTEGQATADLQDDWALDSITI